MRQHGCSEPWGGFALRIMLNKSFLAAFTAFLGQQPGIFVLFFLPYLGPAPGILSAACVRLIETRWTVVLNETVSERLAQTQQNISRVRWKNRNLAALTTPRHDTISSAGLWYLFYVTMTKIQCSLCIYILVSLVSRTTLQCTRNPIAQKYVIITTWKRGFCWNTEWNKGTLCGLPALPSWRSRCRAPRTPAARCHCTSGIGSPPSPGIRRHRSKKTAKTRRKDNEMSSWTNLDIPGSPPALPRNSLKHQHWEPRLFSAFQDPK